MIILAYKIYWYDDCLHDNQLLKYKMHSGTQKKIKTTQVSEV